MYTGLGDRASNKRKRCKIILIVRNNGTIITVTDARFARIASVINRDYRIPIPIPGYRDLLPDRGPMIKDMCATAYVDKMVFLNCFLWEDVTPEGWGVMSVGGVGRGISGTSDRT
jgi:hypothetical protein